ncbi:MAG: hypothetical protein HY880_07785 [Deltaproteobacteria bacterium]|nr:hypothetical protein [Deltaproteobacteria bacterium]
MRFSSKIFKPGDPGEPRLFIVEPVLPPHEMKAQLGRKNEEQRIFEIERDAFEKGFAAGETAGMEFGRKKLEAAVKRFESIVDEFEAFKKTYYAEHEKEIIGLVLSAAKSVVHAEVLVNREVVVNVVRAAVRALVSSERVAIKLNPEDLRNIRDINPGFLKSIEAERPCTVEGSEDVPTGGCLIESGHTEVDARIEEALKAVETAMKEALGREVRTSKDNDREH